jgi:hypothetical protein
MIDRKREEHRTVTSRHAAYMRDYFVRIAPDRVRGTASMVDWDKVDIVDARTIIDMKDQNRWPSVEYFMMKKLPKLK